MGLPSGLPPKPFTIHVSRFTSRGTEFLSILRGVLLLSQTCGLLNLNLTLKQLVTDLTLDKVILQEECLQKA